MYRLTDPRWEDSHGSAVFFFKSGFINMNDFLRGVIGTVERVVVDKVVGIAVVAERMDTGDGIRSGISSSGGIMTVLDRVKNSDCSLSIQFGFGS